VACPLCESKWFKYFKPREKKKEFVDVDFIDDKILKKIQVWNKTKYSPTKAQVEVLKKIGATPPDLYGNYSDLIQFPCKCVLKDGKELEFCIVTFAPSPFINGLEKIIYISDVKSIKPSPYTLSPAVRYATTRADEIRMSYAPTVVELPTGGKHVFNWTNDFYATEKIKGSQITKVLDIDPYDITTAGKSETGKNIKMKIHTIYADWDDEFLKYELNSKNLKKF
ncbi:MAG: hypothetical protein KDK36_18655, partial [Leptospiraceae bacterium]|nr:hypothetical protein [Leptospiraceae bacterium]